MLLAACVAGLAVAARERWRHPSVDAHGRARRPIGTIACVVAAGICCVGSVAVTLFHEPRGPLRSGLEPSGAQSTEVAGGHVSDTGLGGRPDIYRVALDVFLAHPVVGIGIDNFRGEYLKRRHGTESPRYPHSVELMALSETGVVGFVLVAAGLGAGLATAVRGSRRCLVEPAASTLLATLAVFSYWLLHASIDWLWEIAGLGAQAFAMLGISMAVASESQRSPARTSTSRRLRAPSPPGLRILADSWAGIATGLIVAGAAVSLGIEWLSHG
jgi:hypothetical protein